MLLPEIKTRPTAKIEVPVQFSRIRDIAYNLWWTWSPLAHRLFAEIDAHRWMHYHNPIELLIDLEAERWHELQKDEEFIRNYRAVVEQFDAYLAPEEPTWFARHYPDWDRGPVAYFSTEFGWHECLQVYSGGLGILSGDHSKAASDLGLPFVGVGLMYRHGYFRQTIDADGQQQHFYPDYDLHRVPLLPVIDGAGRELTRSLRLPGRRVHFRVLKADVGRVAVLLLDTDLAINHPADRPITSLLYVSGREMRLCQEMLLGLGGVKTLKALGIAPAVWHMNEGHSALLSMERLADAARRGDRDIDESLAEIAENALFTTHTPVPAGNEVFDQDLVRRYVEDWASETSMDPDQVCNLGKGTDDDGSFNMTVLALRASGRANGVSRLHGEVAGQMWNHLLAETGRSVEYVTNGVHAPSWIGPEVGALVRSALGGLEEQLLDPRFTELIETIDDEPIWQAHSAQKRRLVGVTRQLALEQFARHGRSPDELRELDHLLDPEVLLVGFARRFATYKRADLILRDLDRFKELIGVTDGQVQFLFAGKAHPADRPGQDLIRRIWQASLDPELRGRLLFLENYDMRIGRFMVQGVDLWLNTPRRPLEASGTSGMKAAINGGLNLSVLDGWWAEGYDAAHGWAIGDPEQNADPERQDDLDADALYRTITDEIVPCYYERDDRGLPRAWAARMKNSIAMLTPRFCAARMVREYAERFYL